jgi:UDP-N-acetylglucosamine--N-acetylmuramyl-(pentapeptide) pyrophosphoryl-undecaprenol N-acetylglucosamine transferase
MRAEGVVGRGVLKQVRALGIFVLSFRQARRIIQDLRPNIVIGVGGYASAAMVLVAALKGIPTLILEQNSVPGFANRFLCFFARAIAVTYQESLPYFPREKTFLTGNPVRKHLVGRDIQNSGGTFGLLKDRCTIFVFGGSLGAAKINQAMIDALPHLLDLRQAIQFLHQTGERDHQKANEAYRRLGFHAAVLPFIHQMAEAYSASDFVVCRAGATTLAEVTAIGKAAVLIPYPHAASNHQEHNARKLEDLGAAIMLLDRECSGEALARAIRELYANIDKRLAMQKASKACGRIDAADRIVDLGMSIMRKR